MGFLIDTCIWIDVECGRLAPVDIASFTGQEAVYISPVTIAELKFGVEITKDRNLRQKRQVALHRLLKKPLLRIDAMTGDIFGSLSATLRSQGRGHEFRIQDLWLASQAVQYHYPLVTHNLKDFQDIPGLELVAIPVA
jgi:predicted nucleic acid-binding protein